MFLLILLILIAAVAAYKLLPVCSGNYQTFTDIILENVSLSGFNKSGELQLFWIILCTGALILCTGLFVYHRVKASGSSSSQNITSIFDYRLPLYAGMFVIPFFAYLLVFGQFSIPLFVGMVVFILSKFICPDLTATNLLIFALSYYGLMSLLTVAVHFTPKAVLSSAFIYIAAFGIALLLSLIVLIRSKKNASDGYGRRFLLILQCLLPGLLSVWLVDDYLYQGQQIQVPYAPGYVVFFSMFIGFSLAFAVKQAVTCWNASIPYRIGAVTPILIYVYHSFSAAPLYAQPDQHHHGEQMIPWNQIFEHGQTLYEQYTPVSGLFPFVNGFIHNIFLGGTVTEYAASISITMVIFSAITIYLVYKHVGGAYATTFAILFTLPCYNRQYMVLPVLLLLTLPGLYKRKNLWLQLWVFTCFLSGLYYPLFGASLLIGTLPMGICQAVTYAKQGKLKKDCRKLTFIIPWGILLLIILSNVPLLVNMLKHTLTYSSQTIMADGIPLLGQTAPDYFMPYLSDFYGLRQAFYFSLRFMLPVVAVWLFVYFLYYAIKEKYHALALSLIAGAITLMISYTYTLVRADTGKILSRTAMILLSVMGMFLPILLIRYGNKLCKHTAATAVIGICVSLPMVLFAQISHTKNPDIWVYPDGESQLVMDDAAKLFSYYEVPDIFLKSEDTGLTARYQKLLGDGFMVSDQLHYITEYAAVIEKCEVASNGETITYMAFDGQGFYDYLGVACSSTGFIPAARSYEAQEEIWNTASDHLPVVFFIRPEYNYYIFRHMLDAGYVYCSADHAFYPPALFEKVYGTKASGDDYRTVAPATDFSTHTASFGASMDTLDIFCQEASLSLSSDKKEAFPSVINGKAYDCLYLELSEEYINNLPMAPFLTITWTDCEGNTHENYMVTCYLSNTENGKLLIPMGMNAGWLLSDIRDFTISVYAGSGIIEKYDEVTYHELITNHEMPDFMEEMTLMSIDLER